MSSEKSEETYNHRIYKEPWTLLVRSVEEYNNIRSLFHKFDQHYVVPIYTQRMKFITNVFDDGSIHKSKSSLWSSSEPTEARKKFCKIFTIDSFILQMGLFEQSEQNKEVSEKLLKLREEKQKLFEQIEEKKQQLEKNYSIMEKKLLDELDLKF